jgi:type III pantothenate kinase
MNLLIDLGNSRIKWAVAEGAELRERGAAHYAGRRLTDVLETMVRIDGSLRQGLVASVAGRGVNRELVSWFQRRYRLEPSFVHAQAAGFGIVNAYPEPDRMGADRWAALIGARRRTSDAVSVVDCGTAITVDFLNHHGQHLGGLIGPGILTMRRALYGATAGIPDEGEGAVTPLATDTRSAVTAGTLYAAAAFVDRVHAEVEREQAGPLPCLITGGDAPLLQPLLQARSEWARDLVLEGLACILHWRP